MGLLLQNDDRAINKTGAQLNKCTIHNVYITLNCNELWARNNLIMFPHNQAIKL